MKYNSTQDTYTIRCYVPFYLFSIIKLGKNRAFYNLFIRNTLKKLANYIYQKHQFRTIEFPQIKFRHEIQNTNIINLKAFNIQILDKPTLKQKIGLEPIECIIFFKSY